MSLPDFAEEVLLHCAVIDLAFPNDKAQPSKSFKLENIACIPSGVAFELVLPELRIAFRHNRVLASGMLMPEAAVNKYRSAVFAKNDIRFASESFYVEAVAEAM